ncbi:uncharacterized protein METZ01_LOCUS225970 [marine metagenome]|uniref:Uncharacterized protein n=1 Tax=marine metagenome TaxID=408172 RepID=A0A382GD02_9ZZZZ
MHTAVVVFVDALYLKEQSAGSNQRTPAVDGVCSSFTATN